MNEQDAFRAVGRLMGGSPGPWDEPVVNTYVETFMEWSGPCAGEALDAVSRVLVEQWDQLVRPPLQEIKMRWIAEQARRVKAIEAVPADRVHCDGTGWRQGVDGVIPCRRCNPAIAAVYDDVDKLARWRAGTSLADLDVGVMWARGHRLAYTDERVLPVCEPDWVHDDTLTLDLDVGRRVMWEAYAAQCVEDGRKPSGVEYDRWAPVGA